MTKADCYEVPLKIKTGDSMVIVEDGVAQADVTVTVRGATVLFEVIAHTKKAKENACMSAEGESGTRFFLLLGSECEVGKIDPPYAHVFMHLPWHQQAHRRSVWESVLAEADVTSS